MACNLLSANGTIGAMTRTVLTGDDLPDFLLLSFVDHRAMVGTYPRQLYVCELLGEIMDAEPGLWRPDRRGLWYWRRNLSSDALDGMDEFGQPE